MEAEERDRVSKQADALRLDLKAWEKEIAAGNGGKKPSREQIKANLSIAKKYSQYNKLRDVLSGKRPYQRSASPPPKARKRRHEEDESITPSKRIATTPSKSALHPSNVDPYDSPSLIRTLFTPSQRKIIAPTPQKDGLPLGLFDVLSEEEPTPRSNTTTIANNIHATPSKRSRLSEDSFSAQKHARTPASSGKRFMLKSFLTPSKNHGGPSQEQRTPQQSVSKLNFFSTPTFLRRGAPMRETLASIAEAEDAEPQSPQMVRGPRKPLVRGLSSMLASLRGMQEEAADEDLDILRELESGISTAPTKSQTKPTDPEVQVEDSQVQPALLGGFDDEAMFDSEPEEALDRGQPLQIFKKKGQKRTTRKVNIKPVRTKASASASLRPPDSDSEDEISQHIPPDLDEGIAPPEDLITETQLQENGFADARNFDTDSSGSEYTASEGGTRRRRPNQIKKKIIVVENDLGEEKVVRVKAKVKKATAVGMQNFKRLKLRNSGAKGGPGVGSKFRRRR